MTTDPVDPIEWREREERELARLRRKIENRRAGISATAMALWTIAAILALALLLYFAQNWRSLR